GKPPPPRRRRGGAPAHPTGRGWGERARGAPPPLQQVVATTYEAGLRGNLPFDGGRAEWKIGAFRTDSFNDIIHEASFIFGRGFFTNVAATRRQGVEAGVQYPAEKMAPLAHHHLL